jgi:4-amino-4-deoxy-L-arabinose transferase-like glycosyltransferase
VTDLLSRAKERIRRDPDPWIASGFAATYVVWLLATARSLGFSRDEGFYFTAATEYKRWFLLLAEHPSQAFERTSIDAIWAANHEHPSLMKSLFGLSQHVFHDRFHVFNDSSTAFRFPAMLTMGLALWVTYMFAARAYSRRAGTAAVLALGLMPNVFYHAHIACFDVPIMAMWASCVYVYYRAEGGGRRGDEPPPGVGWALLAGIVYGLTLETKHNSWMLPAVFVPHAVLVHGRAIGRHAAKTGRVSIPATLVMMATVGPAVFVLLWPWLWNDTLARFQQYVNFHLHHEYYNIEFLGHTYFGPPSPRAYMPVMIAATVPTASLVLFAIGTVDRLRAIAARAAEAAGGVVRRRLAFLGTAPRDRLQTDALILLALAVPLGVFLLPKTPIFGGTKHWMPAYPFLAILAGRGFDLVWARLEPLLTSRLALDASSVRRRALAQTIAIAVTFSGAFAVTEHSHPFGLSTYVPFVGGTAGGADLGLNRQFWGFTTQSLAPYFEEKAPRGATVYIMDTAWASWQRMIDEGRLRRDLRGVGSPAEALFSIVHHEQHMNEVDYNIWTEYGQPNPDHVLLHDGVPIISVYRRR